MKHLTIHNFGPIKDVDIELGRINVIIGPQNSGKSTVLKIACYCDWIEKQVELYQNPDKYCSYNFFVANLIGFHKLESYMHADSYIKYENDALSFEFSENLKSCSYKWDDSKRWDYKRVKIAYIPAERNLVAAIPNWYQVSMHNDNILDFMKEWEFARRTFSKGERILDLPVTYQYNTSSQEDKIKLDNGKELDLTVASSGVQSLTPLYVMLRYLTSGFYMTAQSNVEQSIIKENLRNIVKTEQSTLSEEIRDNIVDSILTHHHTDLYIEEPEAHIYPSTQKSFVYSMAEMLNGEKKHSCFISTHSPYILTAFNNLILAGEKIYGARDEVQKIISEEQTLSYDEVAAFEMKDGEAHCIMDADFRLISADAIDNASIEIGNDFDYLLNL